MFQINTGTKVYSQITMQYNPAFTVPMGKFMYKHIIIKIIIYKTQALALVYSCIIVLLLSDVHTDTNILAHTYIYFLPLTHTHTH